MTFSEFQKTDFYTWKKNFIAPLFKKNNKGKGTMEDVMIGFFNLDCFDDMFKHFEENRADYENIRNT